jgi:cysteine desulfurase / selenocysteine lyase
MAVVLERSSQGFDVERIRQDFPILSRQINGFPLAYLDNAATTQKPLRMIDRMSDFYKNEYGTVRRGVYHLSAVATMEFEAVRNQVASFIKAPSSDNIVFVRGCTEAINLVAASFIRPQLQPGDVIVVSGLEHHANIVPWQMVCEEKGASLRVIPVLDDGSLDLANLDTVLTGPVKLLAVTHTSNALGVITPIKNLINSAHRHGVPVLVDGAQAIPHIPVDMQDLDCDFYTFSGHKLYGPTGIGVLYAKKEYLEKMIPYQGGGDMIETVTFEKTTFNKPPQRFEAGTPAIAEVIGLGASLEYIHEIGMDTIAHAEQTILRYANSALAHVPGLKILGTHPCKAAVISFVFENIHPHDIGTLLDERGIAVRAGHHCAQPVMQRFKIPATTRASFSFYNTTAEVDRLVDGLNHIYRLFSSY